MSLGPLPLNMYFGIVVGFFATVVVASALNRFGDEMFRRGVARPFFLGRRRLHHRQFLFVVLPAAYAVLSALILAGYVTVVWSLLWQGLAGTVAVGASCLLLDLFVDHARKGGGWGYIHHELIYFAVPAFAFSNFLRLAL
ncbi:MAG: hypothetical protein KGI38_07770 [Thaumarchaeota archaeon]|nr:hypothetical protein [Nitrososphaerota archaeon]